MRSLSRYHRDAPVRARRRRRRAPRVALRAGRVAAAALFGGNSNWRGPIWFPINYLLIEALQKFHHYYGDDFLVECPTGSGQHAHALARSPTSSRGRLIAHLPARRRTAAGPSSATTELFQHDPHWRDHILFYEYFHGDTGAGLGASHQTGWTALVAKLLEQSSHDSAREWTLREGLAHTPERMTMNEAHILA